MSVPTYNLQKVQESYNRIANESLKAKAPEPGGTKVTASEVKALFTAARGSDRRMSVDEKVRLASEWGGLQGFADDGARAEFAKLSKGLGLPDPKQLDAIRGALRLSWGPRVDSPAPQVTGKHLQDAVAAAGRDKTGKLDEASKFLIAYEWRAIPDRCKSPQVKQEYDKLSRELGLPTFSEGRRNARDLGIG